MRLRARTIVSLASLALTALLATPAHAASAPFQDPAAQGYLGICDEAGQQITSGSTATVPFAWRVVSTQPAVAPYNNSYRTAVLVAYQPINGEVPALWSGEALTASSRYSNPSHPMAAATTGDMSLADFVRDFPPRWDGLVQLRLYLDTSDEPVYSRHYPALDIQVTGSTWHALDGGVVNCHAGRAISIETILLPTTTIGSHTTSTTSPATTGSTTSTTVARSTTTLGSTSTSTSVSTTSTTTGPTTTTSTALPTGSSRSTAKWGWISIGAAVLVIVAFLLGRRSRVKVASDETSEPERP